MSLSVSDVARMIDHSLLHPTMTDETLRERAEFLARQKYFQAAYNSKR